ncbi:hypothetical protein CH373_07280 [Leptospira perolatii]|uniref:PH domain-containing protein n=1 Tax=Leptospira perolatii TaxID=2023191 RepID=A0A2M9ZPB5_9LEPT|nr:hypothetical protein [Leptospira perolatii]PJZ70721.1 hypothetical protein CH360_04140 [Leptospira perolatii]PJZ73930.1 hypothetical protein CH373_07280 [Leptospira perolatii]
MYEHTQSSWWFRIPLLLGTLFPGVAGFFNPAHAESYRWAMWSVSALIFACLVLFWDLRVSVDQKQVLVRFGLGLIFRRIQMPDIINAKAVRNSWWYGWGVRYTPHGWMFNIYGLDAVEVSLRNGSKFRIGTDQPDLLTNAIQKNLGK